MPLKDDNPTDSLPLVTLGIILANGAVFFHQITLDFPLSQRFLFQWAAVPYQITHGEILHVPPIIPLPLTLFSSMFLHGGFLHLLGNMLYLWIFGNNIEDRLGHFRFLLFYLLCGLLAAILQISTDPDSTVPMIGASGAIAGILGGYLLLFPRAQVVTLVFIFIFIRILRLPALLILGFWFLVQVMSLGGGLTSNVAFFAHIGGFVSGLILIKPFQPASRRGRRR
ncbi:MAG: rhomboid family intramembrane serine protease [Deltaproteobacteria bacterium]|nr:rhomboid family intramembrane serine protease [Deltaproteobacteria bacterium]